MSKLITEDYFLSGFFLRIFEPYFFPEKYRDDEDGDKPKKKIDDKSKIIITKRIIDFEFNNTLNITVTGGDYSVFMRKGESIAVILYATLCAQLNESQHPYLLPKDLPLKEKERIKKFYGKETTSQIYRTYQSIYKEYCGPIEADSEYEFFLRVDNLFSLPANVNIVLCSILGPKPYSKTISDEKTEFLISEKDYYSFNIRDHDFYDFYEEGTKEQTGFLKYFFKEGECKQYSEEVFRTLSNVIHWFFGKVSEKEKLETVIKWEFNRLQLAKIIDSGSLQKEDSEKLVNFLLAALPKPKIVQVTLPESKTFPPKVQSILEAFSKRKCTLSKIVGESFTSAQLSGLWANMYERQSRVTGEMVKELKTKIVLCKPKDALEIKRAITAAEVGLERFSCNELQEEIKNRQAIIEITRQELSQIELKIDAIEKSTEKRKQPVPVELRYRKNMVKKSIEELELKLESQKQKLNLKQARSAISSSEASYSQSRVIMMPSPSSSSVPASVNKSGGKSPAP